MEVLDSLLDIATTLDSGNMLEEADRVDQLITRIAQYGLMTNHFNVPIQDRVVPWSDVGSAHSDADSDFWKHPRFRANDTESSGDTDADFGKNTSVLTRIKVPAEALDEVVKIMKKIGGSARVITGKDVEPTTPFNMDDHNRNHGGSEFHMHGDGVQGFQYVTHDSQSAGMVGLDKFTEKSQMMDNLQSPYHRLLPQK